MMYNSEIMLYTERPLWKPKTIITSSYEAFISTTQTYNHGIIDVYLTEDGASFVDPIEGTINPFGIEVCSTGSGAEIVYSPNFTIPMGVVSMLHAPLRKFATAWKLGYTSSKHIFHQPDFRIFDEGNCEMDEEMIGQYLQRCKSQNIFTWDGVNFGAFMNMRRDYQSPHAIEVGFPQYPWPVIPIGSSFDAMLGYFDEDAEM